MTVALHPPPYWSVIPLVSHTHVCPSRLRFLFAVRARFEQDTVCLRNTNGQREMRPDSPLVVSAFAHFGCEIPGTAWQLCVTTFKAVPDADCPRMATIQYGKPQTHASATLVFEHPVQMWNATLLSHYWQAYPCQVRARLFTKEEVLRALTHKQHATWASYRLAHTCGSDEPGAETLHALTRWAGLRNARTLNEVCASLFGVEPATLLAGNAGSVSGLVHDSTTPLERWVQPLIMAL